MHKLSGWIADVFLWGAFALLGLSVLEVIANAFQYTVLRGFYSKGRLLEFAAVLLVFVVAITVRQIRRESQPRSG